VPTVINNGTFVKLWGGGVFKPGEEQKIKFFIPPEVGLTLISEEPRVSPGCMASGRISLAAGGSEEIMIPICDEFCASFVCLSGSIEVRQNYADATAVSVTLDIDYEIQYKRADVEKIIVTAVAGAEFAYDIERVM
jgi:hypothetical protein